VISGQVRPAVVSLGLFTLLVRRNVKIFTTEGHRGFTEDHGGLFFGGIWMVRVGLGGGLVLGTTRGF